MWAQPLHDEKTPGPRVLVIESLEWTQQSYAGITGPGSISSASSIILLFPLPPPAGAILRLRLVWQCHWRAAL